MKDKIKELEELTGKIISKALHMEGYLEFFISNYFIRPQNQKTFFFENIILLDMTFEEKLKIFTKICKKEGFDSQKINEAIKCIRIVQKIRNDFAHQHIIINPVEGEIFFGNRKKSSFELLDPKKKFGIVEENTFRAVEIIVDFHETYNKREKELIKKLLKESK